MIVYKVIGTLRGRRRPKKTWVAVVRNDLKVLNFIYKIAFGRIEWKCNTHVADPS